MAYDMTNLLEIGVCSSNSRHIDPRADKGLPGRIAEHCLVIEIGLVVRHVDALASSVGAGVVAVNLGSDWGQSHVQGPAPDVVAPQIVERSHRLLVQSSDALVNRVPLFVISGTLQEGVWISLCVVFQ